MAKVSVSASRNFSVAADKATVFALLADVPASAGHFPGLEKLDDLGGNTYRWNMEELGAMGVTHQVVYTCAYVSDEGAGSIKWSPVASGGNSEISGAWKLTDNGNGTTLEFNTNGEIDIPVPRLMVKMAKGVVQGQFEDQLDTYMANLKTAFS